MTILAPSRASRWAIPLPIPRLAPVTIATFPSRRAGVSATVSPAQRPWPLRSARKFHLADSGRLARPATPTAAGPRGSALPPPVERHNPRGARSSEPHRPGQGARPPATASVHHHPTAAALRGRGDAAPVL